MKKIKLNIIIGIAALLALSLYGSAFAQMHDPMGGGGRRGFGDPDGGGFRGGFQERNLENLRLLKMLEMLELDEDQTVQFIAIYSQFRKEMKEIGDSTEAEVNRLAELLNADEIDEAKVLESVDKIHGFHEARFELMKKVRDKSSEFLTVEQIGKLVIFNERFDRELLESLQGFRGRGKSGIGGLGR